jgi:hypothetical protein
MARNMKKNTELSLVFHTLFEEEFSGSSPQDIVQALFENSKKGLGDITFEQWWDYQRNLWSQKYRFQIPDHDAEGASQALLDSLLQVGALEKGVLPVSSHESRGLDVG